ncbi:hypothetical protein [Ekhidna sp.]
MHTFIDYTTKSDKLVQTLEELKGIGMLARYEFREGPRQVRIEVHQDRHLIFVGVILGQFPEIRNIFIERFKKFRGNS